MAPLSVVVDGSNLATEGRSLPSLTQLEEAVQAYQLEHPEASMIVVVDATFEHRIDSSERDRLKEAELHGEVVAPPAGTIGRGDVFILKIAERQNAVVLSNDSFQEFHGDFPWLFEEGRLVGGKPVTGVGWIFTERTPVRGPKKRQSGRNAPTPSSAPTKPVKKLAVKRPDGSAPKVGDVLTLSPSSPAPKIRAYDLAKELGIETKSLQALAGTIGLEIASHASSVLLPDAERLRIAYGEKKIRAYELAKELGVDTKEIKALAKIAKVSLASHSSSLSEAEADRIRAANGRSAVIADVLANLEQEVPRPRRSKSKKKAGDDLAKNKKKSKVQQSSMALGEAKVAESKHRGTKKLAKTKAPAPTKSKSTAKSGSIPSNEPLDLVSFLAHYKVGGAVTGVVASFTSHGAMVDVDLGAGRQFHCYVRTARLGQPAPQRARDVVSKGETYKFKVAAIDASRRVAELELR